MAETDMARFGTMVSGGEPRGVPEGALALIRRTLLAMVEARLYGLTVPSLPVELREVVRAVLFVGAGTLVPLTGEPLLQVGTREVRGETVAGDVTWTHAEPILQDWNAHHPFGREQAAQASQRVLVPSCGHPQCVSAGECLALRHAEERAAMPHAPAATTAEGGRAAPAFARRTGLLRRAGQAPGIAESIVEIDDTAMTATPARAISDDESWKKPTAAKNAGFGRNDPG